MFDSQPTHQVAQLSLSSRASDTGFWLPWVPTLKGKYSHRNIHTNKNKSYNMKAQLFGPRTQIFHN